MIKKFLLLCVAVLAVCGIAQAKDKKIFLMSDIHVMAPELLVSDGTAFQKYLKTDPKLLQNSEEILKTMVDTILSERPDLVLIPGDLTKDGELKSHQCVISHLEQIRQAGIQVIVIPGNHDIDNPEGVYYNGDTSYYAERVSKEMFAQLYDNYGYGNAIARDNNSLSYVVEPWNGLRLLCLDSNEYYDNLYKEKGDSIDRNQTGGRITPATLAWALDQADKATNDGAMMVGVNHHLMFEHYDGQSYAESQYIIENFDSVSKQMIEHGVKLFFTGHQHLQDIATLYKDSQKTDSLIDVATGATASYPCPFRRVTIDENYSHWNITSGNITAIPNIPNLQDSAYTLLQGATLGGIEWHISDKWASIIKYTQSNLAKTFIETSGIKIPDSPQELSKLVVKYLGDPGIRAFAIHLRGNEGDDPASMPLRAELRDSIHSLYTAMGGKDNVWQFGSILLFGYINPYLNSFLSDSTKYNKANLANITDDLNLEILMQGTSTAINDLQDSSKPTDEDGSIYDLMGRRYDALPQSEGIYIINHKKVWVRRH